MASNTSKKPMASSKDVSSMFGNIKKKSSVVEQVKQNLEIKEEQKEEALENEASDVEAEEIIFNKKSETENVVVKNDAENKASGNGNELQVRITVSLPAKVNKMAEAGALAYKFKGNKSQYVSYLIQKDYEENKAKYDFAMEMI